MSYFHLALKCHKQAFYRAGAYYTFYTLSVAMHQLQCLSQFSSHHTSQYSIMHISSAAQLCAESHTQHCIYAPQPSVQGGTSMPCIFCGPYADSSELSGLSNKQERLSC